ncbi:MAG: GGDEF domain-containing protein [Spirochaetales bacterium]|nr:GGDEF domain-containing protein [Spirochaetales bacterium]
MLDLLKQIDLFSRLSSRELEVIASFCEYIDLEEGERLFAEGDRGDALYIVKTGEIVVQKVAEYSEGPDTQLARYIPGNSLGELDLFNGEPRQADALASTDTTVLRFPGRDRDFSSFLESQPLIAAQVLHRMLVLVSDRIRSANDLVKENSPLVQELKKQVYRDKLTGIYNQSYLTETLQEHINKSGTPFTVLISKPDNFKELNDNYGHEAGDKAICLMARELRDFIGDDSRTVRYKGNAMAVILYSANRKEAYVKAGEIQSFIHSLDLSSLTGTDQFKLTASVGIGIYPTHNQKVEELLTMIHELPLMGRKRGGEKILAYKKRSKEND